MIKCDVIDERTEKGWQITFAVIPRIGETIRIENFNRKVIDVYYVADGPHAGKIIIRVKID